MLKTVTHERLVQQGSTDPDGRRLSALQGRPARNAAARWREDELLEVLAPTRPRRRPTSLTCWDGGCATGAPTKSGCAGTRGVFDKAKLMHQEQGQFCANAGGEETFATISKTAEGSDHTSRQIGAARKITPDIDVPTAREKRAGTSLDFQRVPTCSDARGTQRRRPEQVFRQESSETSPTGTVRGGTEHTLPFGGYVRPRPVLRGAFDLSRRIGTPPVRARPPTIKICARSTGISTSKAENL